MTARKVWWSGAWLELGGGATDPTDQYPSNPLADQVDTGTSLRTTVTATASGTPHANGSYVEIDPSLSADCAGVWVIVTATTAASTADSSTLLELATGAAASEVAWASVGVGYRTGVQAYFVPGFIASGTRVAFRARSAVASQSLPCVFSFLRTKTEVPGAPVTYGVNTATSAGVAVAGTSVNTKSGWVEIAASTSAAHSRLLVCPQGGSDAVMATGNALIDIGIGAGGAETVLIGDIYATQTAAEVFAIRSPLTYGVNIPAGSRLSARWARDSTSNSLDVLLVGA